MNKYPDQLYLNNNRNSLFIAEMSGNHNKSFDRAMQIVRAAQTSGADAVKLQTFTPDTITMKSSEPNFMIKGTLWDGMTLHDLYEKIYMPWDWQVDLAAEIRNMGMLFISSPFDNSAVDFLFKIGVDAYKVASPEIIDIPLLKYISETGVPVIMSTGMASLGEIEKAVNVILSGKTKNLTLLKCTSAYPAPIDQMNLAVIPVLAKVFELPVGLSDHSMGIEAPIVAGSLGAVIFEKHLTLSRAEGGLDSEFSIEPHEFELMVKSVKLAKISLGSVKFGPTINETTPYKFRRSLYVSTLIKKGEILTDKNIKSIRPGGGILPEFFYDLLGKRARYDLNPGLPLIWDMVEGKDD